MSRYFWLAFGGLWFAAGAAFLFDTYRAVRLEQSDDVYLTGGIASFFTLAGGMILLVDIRRRFIDAKLLRSGLGALATVTDVAAANVRFNGVTQWRVLYRYTDHLGRVQLGKSRLLAPEEAEIWSKGDTAQVRYDPHRTNRSIWLAEH